MIVKTIQKEKQEKLYMESGKCFRIVYAGIAAAMLVGMVVYSGFQEFWYDEVYQIGLVGSGLSVKDVFTEYMQLKDYTPPVFALISYLWIRIVPFSFRYLLLVPELMTAAGVFFTALAGEKMGGKKTGFLAEIFAVTSSVLVLAAGYEFRAYALYFMAVSLLFFQLAKRVRTGKVHFAGLMISLVLVLYSHYYGSVIVGVLFLIELIFVFLKRQKYTVIFPYLLAGCSFVPWLFLVLLNRTRSITEFWIQPPDLQSIFKLLEYLCSENEFLIGVFCLGLTGCFASVGCTVREKKFDYKRDAMKVYVSGVITGVVAIMFIYGTLINPSGGIFYNRYFVGILPCCFLVMAYGAVKSWEALSVRFRGTRQSFIVFALALFLFTFVQNGNTFMSDIKQEQTLSYTASVKEMSRKVDIGKPDTVVVTSDNSYVRKGVEMYFENMFHTEVNVLSQHDEVFATEVSGYKKLYVFQGKQPLTDETKEILSGCKQLAKDREKRITEYEYPESIKNEKDEVK